MQEGEDRQFSNAATFSKLEEWTLRLVELKARILSSIEERADK